MTPAALIAQAAAEGISLAISETGNIKAVGSGDIVQRWVPVLRQHKATILQALRKTETPHKPSSFDLDEYEERAAIMEYDGGLPRAAAERLAAEAQGFSVTELRKRRVLH